MFSLEIGCHATIHRVLFPTIEEAQAQLDLIQPKIGQHFYGKDGELEHSHTIKSPAGDVVVAIDKVEVVRVLDVMKHNDMARDFQDAEIDRQAELEIRRNKALLKAKAEFLTEKTAE